MTLKTFALCAALLGALSACAVHRDPDGGARAPFAQIEAGAQPARFDYKGATYPLRLTFRDDLRAYHVASRISDGAPWTLVDDEDAVFQNMTRAYFRAQVCAPDKHPGFFQLGYGQTAQGWQGIVICSDKAQADMPE